MIQIFSFVIAFLLAILAFLPFLSRPKEISSKLFLVMSIFLSTWVVSNLFADLDSERSLIWTRIAFFSIVFAIYCFREFVEFFPVEISSKHRTNLYSAITLVVAVLTLTPLIVSRVEFIDGISTVREGSLYFVFIVYYVYFSASALNVLRQKIRKLGGSDRDRARIIMLGVGIMIVLASATNLFLPLLMDNNRYAPLGSGATLAFIGLTAYAMMRHQLFDIRTAITRALAYTMSLTFMLLTYGTAAYFLTTLISVELSSSPGERIAYIVFALVTALIFPRVRKFFDRVTNRVFFRDQADTALFLDALSNSLVSLAGLQGIYENTNSMIVHHIKADFTSLILNDGKGGYTYYGHGGNNLGSLAKAQDMINRYDSALDKSKVRLLEKERIALIMPLVTSEESFGVLIVGEKKNGDTYSNPELASLKIAADEIALAIENSLRYEQIQEFNETLKAEIEQATHKLKLNNEKLKALDVAKDEFISMASHQLRTPLTSVKGYISMVADGDAGEINPQQKQLLDQAFVSSQRMVYLIADLLNVSRLRTGKFIIERNPTYLPDLIEGEISQLVRTAEVRGLKLKFDKPKRFPVLSLDETKIRQVVMNFTDNAIYYTPRGGTITIKLKASKESVFFSVDDTGIGVPKHDVPHLFSKFYRAGNARNARPDGTGLGLFMAKKVVTAQGGAIHFQSKEGKGSSFGFIFPRAKLEVKQG